MGNFKEHLFYRTPLDDCFCFSSILEENFLQLTWKFETWSEYHKSYCLRIISKNTKPRELKKDLSQIFEMGKFILVMVFISLFELMVFVDGEISEVKWNLQ